jgi:hypothetical protein
VAIALEPEILDGGGSRLEQAVTLKIILSPLRGADGHLRVHDQTVDAGDTLRTIFPHVEGWIRVICNGKVLTPDEQATYVLQPGDEVLLFPPWGIEWAVLGPLLIYAAIGLVLSVGLTYLSYVLFPPAKPHIQGGSLDEPTFSFQGIQTAIGPGQVIPVIYGRHRVGGQLLSAAVDQALTVLDGPPPSTSPGLTRAVENVYGGTQNEPITIQITDHGWFNGDHVDVTGVTGKTGANGGWYIGVIDAHRIFLKFTTNTDWNQWTGGGSVTNMPLGVGIRRVDAIATPPTLSMLLAIGEGPIAGVLLDTIEINGQPIGNFPTVQLFTRTGTADQTAIAEFGEQANSFADGREIVGEPGITYTTTQPVQAFVLNIVFNEGIYVITKTGEKQENISTLGYRYRVHPAGEWTPFSYFDVAAARTSTVRFAIRKEGLGLARYDIHVQWSHARDVDELRAKWKPTLESVTEIQSNTNAYPYTALLGLRAVATDALQGSLPNITVEVLGRIMRVNQFDEVLNWSDNPAPCVMDMLTNTRYGLGYPDSTIDLPAFINWWFYNEEIINGEKRHTFNYVLDREQRGQPLLLEMCGASRTVLVKSEGLWTPRVTRNDNAVQLFSWANVTNLKLTYTRDPDRINVMEARFSNEAENFEQDVLTWPTIDNWPVEVRKASVDLRGITKPSRVTRALQFELNRRRFEILSLEMDCATDAVALQVHDIFRFSHPLPGWGASGRLMPGTSSSVLLLDEPVTTEAGKAYHVYVRHSDDTVEIRAIGAPGAGQFTSLVPLTPLVGTPTPFTSLWAFGEETPDKAVKMFRVVRMQRNSDTTVHIQAIAHHPGIYDEPTAQPLPIITSLFNPLGPPPPLSSLVLTEVARVQNSGASRGVVNVAWDVQPLSAGYGPYGGATILRRSVLQSALGGIATAGVTDLGAIQDPTDANVGYVPLVQLRGHILEWDDYTVTQGSTYVYRVVPVSQRGVPNNNGAREGIIHVSGPTTADFFPGTVQNLRLKGQAVGVTTFEGRDVHIEWDPVADSSLFTTTFFVQDYIVEVWAPGQVYRLRQTVVPSRGVGESVEFIYTLEMNMQDQINAGQTTGPRRDLAFYVWARTNTNRMSLLPAILVVNNPPPDMGDMIPEVVPLNGAALVEWDQFVEPRDFDHYEIHIDTINPPIAIYNDIFASSFTGLGSSFRKTMIENLIIGVTYYVYILPYDTFGAGIASHIASFEPVGADLSTLDATPPGIPTGLGLTTGTDISDDGTIFPWIRAAWNMGPESDLAGYELQLRRSGSATPTSFQLGRVNFVRMQPVAGLTEYFVRIAAYDKIHNGSAFTAEVSITTAADTAAPDPPSSLIAQGHVQGIHLLWTPPGDADYLTSEVWASATNDRTAAALVGSGAYSFEHGALPVDAVRYYWVRAVDSSGNIGAYFPTSPTAGVTATAGALTSQFIQSLIADKITSGTLVATYTLGVGSTMTLDGPNRVITVFDEALAARVLLGKVGPESNAYGMRVYNASGGLMWNFTDGAQSLGIAERAVVGGKIAVGALQAEHLTASTLFITGAANIANALINFAHIGNAQILAAHIADANVLRAHIQDLAVNTAKIDALAVTNAKIGDLQVTAAKIQNANILNAHIGDAQITSAKIGDAQITTAKIGDLQVDTLKIGGLAVTTPKINTNAVTESLVYATGAGATSSSGVETQVGSITFPVVVTGDVVLFWITCVGVTTLAGPHTLTLRLRDTSIAGTIINSTAEQDPGPATSISLNGMHAVTGGTFFNKVYVVTVWRSTGTGTVSVSDLTLIGMRLQR